MKLKDFVKTIKYIELDEFGEGMVIGYCKAKDLKKTKNEEFVIRFCPVCKNELITCNELMFYFRCAKCNLVFLIKLKKIKEKPRGRGKKDEC